MCLNRICPRLYAKKTTWRMQVIRQVQNREIGEAKVQVTGHSLQVTGLRSQ